MESPKWYRGVFEHPHFTGNNLSLEHPRGFTVLDYPNPQTNSNIVLGSLRPVIKKKYYLLLSVTFSVSINFKDIHSVAAFLQIDNVEKSRMNSLQAS